MIIAKDLKSMEAVRQELDWKTSSGCHVCRPALNFYLIAAWPTGYQDDCLSRFINEHAHGGIQKDGTLSVVPRMWGGFFTANGRAMAVTVSPRSPAARTTAKQPLRLSSGRVRDH